MLLMIGTNDINGNVNVGQAPTRLGDLIDACSRAATTCSSSSRKSSRVAKTP